VSFASLNGLLLNNSYITSDFLIMVGMKTVNKGLMRQNQNFKFEMFLDKIFSSRRLIEMNGIAVLGVSLTVRGNSSL
jgi:hypothetical protein